MKYYMTFFAKENYHPFLIFIHGSSMLPSFIKPTTKATISTRVTKRVPGANKSLRKYVHI